MFLKYIIAFSYIYMLFIVQPTTYKILDTDELEGS